jgi:hypothetical protein
MGKQSLEPSAIFDGRPLGFPSFFNLSSMDVPPMANLSDDPALTNKFPACLNDVIDLTVDDNEDDEEDDSTKVSWL